MNSAAIALVVPLLTAPLQPQHRPAPSISTADGAAWAVVHAGQLWLCWEPSPRCFERIELDALAEPTPEILDDPSPDATSVDPAPRSAAVLGRDAAWRLGFAGRSLWLSLDDRVFRVERGSRRAREVEGVAPRRLETPRPRSCGPRGAVPALSAGAIGWQPAPTCAAPVVVAQACVGPTGPRLRRPVPLELRAGFELVSEIGWSASADLPRERLGPATVARGPSASLLVVVELGFDFARIHRAGPAAVRRLRSRPLRSLPPVQSGPLAADERAALREILCAEAGR